MAVRLGTLCYRHGVSAALLVLAASTVTWAEESTSANGQSGTQQQNSKPSQQQEGDWHDISVRPASQGSSQKGQSTQQGRRERSTGTDQREARIHYRAGLAAGYMLGYADGMDDYVLVVATPRQGSATDSMSNSESRHSQSRQWRDHIRQQARDRASQQQSQGRTAKSQSQEQQISGEIRSIKRVQLKNDNQKHVLLLVTTDNNQKRIIDAWPVGQLQDFDLQKGNQVQAKGCMLTTRDGVPVLNARQVRSQGQSVAIRDSRQSQQRN